LFLKNVTFQDLTPPSPLKFNIWQLLTENPKKPRSSIFR